MDEKSENELPRRPAIDAKFMLRVLKGMGYESELLWWRTDSDYAPITFFINCNDIFWWACGDAEAVTPYNVDVLEKSLEDVRNLPGHVGDFNGGLLFCARVRKMRPQGAFYRGISPGLATLFDACGPERDLKEPGNTPKPKSEAKAAPEWTKDPTSKARAESLGLVDEPACSACAEWVYCGSSWARHTCKEEAPRAGICVRPEDGHEGPCNGYPRPTCHGFAEFKKEHPEYWP